MKKCTFVLEVILISLFAFSISTSAQEHHPHAQQKEQGSANEFMHQTPVDQLVKRFDSPERDAYQQPEKVLDFLGNIQGKKIMDIGAGSGYFSIKLAKSGAKVIAADVNDKFQDYLKSRIEKENLGNLGIELRKIPYDDPSLKASEVHMVFLSNTYHHIENREEYFVKVRKGLDEEGELVIIDYFKTALPVGPPVDHKVSMDEIVAELKAAGFRQLEVEVDLLPYQFIIRAK